MPHPETRGRGRSWARTTGCRSSARSSSPPPRASRGVSPRLVRDDAGDSVGAAGPTCRAAAPRRRCRPLHRTLGLRTTSWRRSGERLGREPERPRARDVQRDVERALLVQELEAAAAHAAHRGRGRDRRAGRERGRDLDRRRPGGRVQDRVAQPPERRRALPGRGDRRGRHPARHRSRWAPGRSRSSTPCASATRADPRTRHLVDGVVRGVGGYGNCVGVPTVGGELVFDPSYQGNPLVNVMAIGLLEERHLTRAAAPGPGNLVVLFGSTTGPRRDRRRVASSPRPRSAAGPTRSGRACRSAIRSPRSCSSRRRSSSSTRGSGRGSPGSGRRRHHAARISETADRAGTGIVLDLDAVPRREPGHGAVRGHDLGVPGAHGRDRAAGALAGRARGVRALGAAGARSSAA